MLWSTLCRKIDLDHKSWERRSFEDQSVPKRCHINIKLITWVFRLMSLLQVAWVPLCIHSIWVIWMESTQALWGSPINQTSKIGRPWWSRWHVWWDLALHVLKLWCLQMQMKVKRDEVGRLQSMLGSVEAPYNFLQPLQFRLHSQRISWIFEWKILD